MVLVESNSGPYKIVFENEHFVVANKNYGILSVPGRDANDPRPVLGRLLERDLGVQIYPVHRLDFEVQGLILYAKNQAAHQAANMWFLNKEAIKTYSAISTPLENQISVRVGEEYHWSCKLLKGKKRAYISPHGKDSLTVAKLLDRDDLHFYWSLSPITGRSHQLRFELYRHGHPIIGDELYSSPIPFFKNALALRSVRLEFLPTTTHLKFGLPTYFEIEPFLKNKFAK